MFVRLCLAYTKQYYHWMMSASTSFIAVHVGAGNHSKSKENLYKSVCNEACRQAMDLLLSRNITALEAVTEAVKVLENAVCTNAGTGSSLTYEGTVECDASAMDGKTLLFGAVGALKGVSNPSVAAAKLVQDQKKGMLPHGRIRPSILVGDGAGTFCRENNIETNCRLETESTSKTYKKYKRKCDPVVQAEFNKKTKFIENVELDQNNTENVKKRTDFDYTEGVQDTVGAVCVDADGNVASLSSSGGIWLKHAGRLGPATLYGCGCWAKNFLTSDSSNCGVAVVTSGCGEHLIHTLLAKTCAEPLYYSDNLTQDLTNTFQRTFMESEFIASSPNKFGGLLLLKSVTNNTNKEKEVELCWIHSTASMCLSYMSSDSIKPRAIMSRLSQGCTPGQAFIIGGYAG